MKKRTLALSNVIICLINLVISVGLFWNAAVFADEHNASIGDMCGGTAWLYADWGRLFLSAAAVVLAIVLYFMAKKSEK